MSEITLTTYHDVQRAFRRKSLKQALYDEGGVIMRDVLLTLHGDAHRSRRRLENRLFRRETFHLYDSELIPRLIAEEVEPAAANGRADCLGIGHRATLHLTALIAGVDRPAGTAAETERLYHFDLTFSEGATLVHATGNRDAVRQRVATALAAFDEEFLQPSIARRRSLLREVRTGTIDEASLSKDVLTVLLAHESDLADDPDTAAAIIRREIAFFLQAGSHSSANAFTHAMDDLLTWFEEHPQDRRRCLDDPLFMQRCVHESLRLHPASPVAWRVATEDMVLREGLAVAQGTRVIMDLMAANRDPDVFGPDAAEFNPHRPEPEGVPRWGHSFGGGMHVCIGMELDGGTTPDRGAADRAHHVIGVVPQLVGAMLAHGARRDPDHPPGWDDTSARPNFATYPIVFDQ
ncbi:cytochrome P450 [Euzebya tangerina]|uniref:cytochrome P450 n=1 Tax=Euzebya tangerina TaxID=591198 RepID=UPI000E315D27|nr:cytochrome P450 [Euzebya tangerina]